MNYLSRFKEQLKLWSLFIWQFSSECDS